MLRESTVHTDWCEKTMSILREKQFEACERRLNAHQRVSLFSEEATEADAQRLWEGSYYRQEMPPALLSIDDLRSHVLERLPVEAQYLSQGEATLLERLLVCGGVILLGEWDDIGAAEALVSRLWCSFHATDDEWSLELPESLHEPLLLAMNMPQYAQARDVLFRYDAMVMGLLYIAGFLHSVQPIQLFLQDVIKDTSPLALSIARRYLQAAFEYVKNSRGELILLHPGLAEPERLITEIVGEEMFTVELSQEMITGGMNGLLPEEEDLHAAMCAALSGCLRPGYDTAEAAEDLRMLVKQGVDLKELETVMDSMLCVLPTEAMKFALTQLYQRIPHWSGLRACLQH